MRKGLGFCWMTSWVREMIGLAVRASLSACERAGTCASHAGCRLVPGPSGTTEAASDVPVRDRALRRRSSWRPTRPRHASPPGCLGCRLCGARHRPFHPVRADERPRQAIDEVRAWVLGERSVGQARQAALAAHEAARQVDSAAAAAARSAGHAAATAHMADHCSRAAAYALKTVRSAGGDVDAEREWQDSRLAADIRELVLSAR